MPRSSVACAGGCGKTLYTGPGSRPAGERTCQPCRRAGLGPAPRLKTRDCAVCGATFNPCDHRDQPQLTCSRQCGATSRLAKFDSMARPTRPCGDCSATVTWPRVYCPSCAGVRRSEHNQRKNLKRRAGGTRILSIRELAERDRWRCHLCRRRVDSELRYPHPRSASRDHLVPVADGGTNDPTNLALAHWVCNVRRRTGGNVQLQLVV